MEDAEYERIEAEALQIVGTLKKLKKEIKDYRDARVDAEEGLKSLEGLLKKMTIVAVTLKDAAEGIRTSNYAALYQELSARTHDLDVSYDELISKTDALSAMIDEKLEAQAAEQAKRDASLVEALEAKTEHDEKKRDELVERIANLELVIARIDRNTQKGFGKERG